MSRARERLGATEAVIVYRRTREKMPAHDLEIEEALQEGVLVKWLSTIKQAGTDANAGALTIEKMTLDAKATRSRPRVRDAAGRLADPGARAGRDLSLLEGVAGRK